MDLKKLKIFTIITTLIIASFFCALFGFSIKHEKDSKTYYKQGLEYYNKEDYQNAYYNFSKITPLSSLFLNAIYKEAKCADLLNDNKTAIKKYNLLEKSIKNKDITPYIIWRKGNIYYAMENTSKAKKEFLKLKNKYNETEYGIASNYMLYKINEDPSNLIEYIKNSPNGKFAKNALDELLEKNPKLSVEDKIAFAKGLYENEEYEKSVEILKAVPINLSWGYLMKSLDKLNSSENVIKVANKGFEFENLEYSEDFIDEIVSLYIKHSKKPALIATDEIYKTASSSKLKASAFNKNVLSSTYEDALFKKAKLYEKYPDTTYAKDAVFSLFVENLIHGKNILALKYGKLYLGLYKDRRLTPCVLYFTAYLKKKASDQSYTEYIQKLFSEYPNSYYTYLAYANLANSDIKIKGNAKIQTKITIPYPYKEDKKVQKFYENFVRENDLSPFEDFRIKDLIVQSWIEYKKGNRATSIVIAREYIKNSPELPERENAVWKLAYPIYYEKEINYYARQRNLSPYLMLSLIKEESHFNPNIISYVGAVGLMQVMPSTADMMTQDSYTINELSDEKLNIEIGTKYFSYLMNELYENEAYCVLAYNSGPNAVKNWLNQNVNTPFEIMVEKIPYPETKTYIKKVYGAYWNYLLTYENLKLPI